MKTIFYFSLIISLGEMSCLNQASPDSPSKQITAASEWKLLKCGLSRNSKGEIGLETVALREDGTKEKVYLTYVGGTNHPSPTFQTIVDTATFRQLGSTYYQDKNHVYEFFMMADGGIFSVLEVDYDTFEMLGDCYAKDKNYIYCERHHKLTEVDHATFQTAKGAGCVARDKNGYFFWNDRVKRADVDLQEQFTALDDSLKKLK